MTDLSTDARVAGAELQSMQGNGERTDLAINIMLGALFVGATFALYWASSFVLHARNATTHFGADSWYYAELAQGYIFARLPSNYYLDRVTRFHPTTVGLAAAWMHVFQPLTQWIAPLHVLKAMFAAVGAVGALAATWAFAAFVPRRAALVLGMIYATSFGVWYFASFEESKIVTATLSTLYIAGYLHLRKSWTTSGAVLLTAVLLLACLNEMTAGFLVIVPVIDTLIRYGWNWRKGRWIAAHALAGPAAFVIIEGLIFGRLVAATHPEGTSHFGMLFYYIARNHYSLEVLYGFIANWWFFNIAAPTVDATHQIPVGANYKGYFEPSLLNYLKSLTSVGVAVSFCALVVVSVLPRFRPDHRAGAGADNLAGLLLALLAFTVVRGVFFFVFNPAEPLLFSPTVTLPHLLLLAIPFAMSKVPAKPALLGAFGIMLFIANGAFMIGR